MKTKILTLALTALFGIGLINAQEVNKVKFEARKEIRAERRKEHRMKHEEKKEAKHMRHEKGMKKW